MVSVLTVVADTSVLRPFSDSDDVVTRISFQQFSVAFFERLGLTCGT